MAELRFAYAARGYDYAGAIEREYAAAVGMIECL